MKLIFIKKHYNHFREKDLKRLSHEIGSKSLNVTTLTFNWDAAINGRFENRLQAFIEQLPFAYFSIVPVITKGQLKNEFQDLIFEQGKPVAKKVKHALLIHKKINSLQYN